MTITSKFNSKCKKCGRSIAAGQQIEWDKEHGPRHITCPPAPQQLQPQHRQTGGPKNQQPFAPGTAPYRNKFQRLEQVYSTAEQTVAATARPRTTTTLSNRCMTRTA